MSTGVDVEKYTTALLALRDDIREYINDSNTNPIMLRTAWHDAGSSSGANGSIRFEAELYHGGYAGLAKVIKFLEPFKKKYPIVSWADIIQMAGAIAVEAAGGPKIAMRYGRIDGDKPADKEILPGALAPWGEGSAAAHLRAVFGRMGFGDREIVALSGAHALGRCHTDRSGYWGPWTNAPTTFSNEYYRLLLEEKWTPKTTHQGKPWTGPFQYEDKTGNLMMLPTDLALVQDKKMRPIVEEYAKDEKKFFEDFAKAWIKLNELGVDAFRRKYWFF
jgi:cytochrome c peroxidase